MKPKLSLFTLVGLATTTLAALAQTNSPAVAGTKAPSDAVQPSAAAEARETPASETSAARGSVKLAPAQPGAIIPLIVMEDVPLTEAIRNLARQAGLNYMLDPQLAIGQTGPDGKRLPQPSVSIRWENVTAEQALAALLGNHSLQLVEDPKSKIARIVTKDPATPEPLVTKVIQLKFTSPTNIIGTIQNALTDKRGKVVPDLRTSQLVILATEQEQEAVNKLIERLDTQTRQVLIEARLLETQMNPHSDKGIDWSGTLSKQNVTMGNNALQGTAATPASSVLTANGVVTTPANPGTIGGILGAPGVLANASKGSFFQPSTAFLNADGLSAALSFLNTYSETKVISSPRTVTLDTETATIEVGTLFPIVNVTAGTANTTGGSQVSYSNLTVRLEVTPRISANNYVHLSVKPRVLRLGDSVTSTVAGQASSVYSFSTRQLETAVMIPSGNTLVMGGLIEDNIHQENKKVPMLGDIPGLGYLFRWDSKNRQKSNLIVFVTPTIVDERDFQPTKTDYLKTPVPTKDSLEEDWSAWDSGKPAGKSKASDPITAAPAAASTGQFSEVPAR
jgi:type II secretory pathway component GspD/PulD (secretin)